MVGMSWTNSLEVTETTARVHSVSPPHSETYQCGSTKIGEVTVPQWCTRTIYDVTYTVRGTDNQFTSETQNSREIGSEVIAYELRDGTSVSYSLSNPQDASGFIIILIIAVVASLLVGLIAFLVIESIFD